MSLCGNNNPCPDLISGQKCGITYTGARYVPLFADPAQWDNTKAYEPLTIVLNEGNSYTSKTFVPVGVDINNEMYWALTGNYNAQVEAYRQEVVEVKTNLLNLQTNVNNLQTNVNNLNEVIYIDNYLIENPDLDYTTGLNKLIQDRPGSTIIFPNKALTLGKINISKPVNINFNNAIITPISDMLLYLTHDKEPLSFINISNLSVSNNHNNQYNTDYIIVNDGAINCFVDITVLALTINQDIILHKRGYSNVYNIKTRDIIARTGVCIKHKDAGQDPLYSYSNMIQCDLSEINGTAIEVDGGSLFVKGVIQACSRGINFTGANIMRYMDVECYFENNTDYHLSLGKPDGTYQLGYGEITLNNCMFTSATQSTKPAIIVGSAINLFISSVATYNYSSTIFLDKMENANSIQLYLYGSAARLNPNFDPTDKTLLVFKYGNSVNSNTIKFNDYMAFGRENASDGNEHRLVVEGDSLLATPTNSINIGGKYNTLRTLYTRTLWLGDNSGVMRQVGVEADGTLKLIIT